MTRPIDRREVLAAVLRIAAFAAASTAVPAARAADGAAAAAASPSPSSPLPERLRLARALLDALDPSRTAYRHRSVVRLPGDPLGEPVAWTDCSGLLNALLERADPATWAALRAASPRGRPLAIDYVAAIGRGDGFAPVARIDAIAPGDVLAIAYPPGSADTGHVVLVDAPPLPFDGPPRRDGWTQWALPVIDATASPHGPDDARSGPPPRTGAGRGTMRLYADADGRPAGHAWSLGPRSVLRTAFERPIAVGRPL